ncbi:MAG: 50S ribosomal protein L23 [Candidatus Hydrogenedentota bacterium]
MKNQAHYIIKAPVITEESTIMAESKNQYVFKVDPKANKSQIREALEVMFPHIKVVAVNTMNYEGKLKRLGRHMGRRPHWKKAVVTLRQGDHIDLLG